MFLLFALFYSFLKVVREISTQVNEAKGKVCTNIGQRIDICVGNYVFQFYLPFIYIYIYIYIYKEERLNKIELNMQLLRLLRNVRGTYMKRIPPTIPFQKVLWMIMKHAQTEKKNHCHSLLCKEIGTYLLPLWTSSVHFLPQ